MNNVLKPGLRLKLFAWMTNLKANISRKIKLFPIYLTVSFLLIKPIVAEH
jgi:hypothetical protein